MLALLQRRIQRRSDLCESWISGYWYVMTCVCCAHRREQNLGLTTDKPFLFVLNFLSIMQRQAISVAPLGGLTKDLGLAGTQFSTIISLHYVGYILGQLPANLLFTRVPPSSGLATGILLGGVATVTIASVVDYKGLVVQRFFLGVLAAPIWPGTLYITSSFYKRKELGTRIGILYTSNISSTAFQGLIAAPIFSNLGGFRGLGGWQWMFVIVGTAAGVCGSTSTRPLLDVFLTCFDN